MQIRANANENQVINVNSAARARAEERAGKKAQQHNNRKNIFAGDLGMQGDVISMRRQRAQKKALDIVGKAWDGDRAIDQSITDIKDKLSQLHDEVRENMDIIAEGDVRKEELRLQYGVSADSQEQKDLELFEKKADAQRNPNNPQLTEEEEERLAQIKDQPLTEYQTRCMAIDEYQGTYEKRNDQIEEEIKGYNATIRSIRLERLKYHGMVDAQKNADEVLEAAGKDILGLLIDEGKEHVEEELEKPREEAKEKAEEKEEQEEKIEERQEKQEELEARIDETRAENAEEEERRREARERSREDADLLEGMIDAGMGNVGNTTDLQSEIKNMLHKMKLLEEDVKGSTVDDQV